MIPASLTEQREIRCFFHFVGRGLGALGFQEGEARVGRLQAKFRVLGGYDVDPYSCRDATRLTGVPMTCLDMFDREQFVDFHGHEPPSDWREATAADLHHAACGERPHIEFFTAPCKGFSGLLNKKAAKSRKYQALNRLTLRALHLSLEAWSSDPTELILFENVPRIQTRGRHFLDLIIGLLRSYGYVVAETVHDCGELGGLAQRRRRFLLVARHRSKVPPFLYEPPKKRVRGVGEVIGPLPMPEDPAAGPMHRLPRLQWRTWERLALVPAGGDWRDLHKLDWESLAIVPQRRWGGGDLGVTPWGQPSGTVAGESWPRNGRFSVADPRPPRDLGRYQPYGVVPWDQPSRTVTGEAAPGAGPYAVNDPRLGCDIEDKQGRRFNNCYRVIRWDQQSQAVTSGTGPTSGGQAVADPRRPSERPGTHHNKMAVCSWGEPARTVTTSDRVGSGAQSVSDPRMGWSKPRSGEWQGGGHYGVVGWGEAASAVTGHARHDNGAHSVADPRPLSPAELAPMPKPRQVLDPPPRIVSLDGTWHRPFTTLELAALQGFPVEQLYAQPLDGNSHARWREGIGNAVPRATAQAIAGVMGTTLLLAWSGSSFLLSNMPVWVQPFAIPLSADLPA